MGGFVFYDTETTGTDTSFDQILQFAAIHTDADLNELDRFEIRCRIQPTITPSPMAMYITGVSAEQLTSPSSPSHYEMICQIRNKLLQWSPAVFMGYNSIDFDEHLLRSAFYQTLHPPYLTNTNGNARSDVMRMVQSAHFFSPGSIRIPNGDNGKPSFKLDRLAPANGFEHKNAHDALADVEATIYMCRLVSEHAPDVWSSFMRFSQKSAVLDFISSEPVFSFTEFYYGKPFSCLATTIGKNSTNTAEIYMFNLAVNPEELAGMDDRQLQKRLSEQPKPIRSLRSNACPILMPSEDAPESVIGKIITYEELETRAEYLANYPEIRQRFIDAHESAKVDYESSVYVEKQLYEGFFNSGDLVLMEKFHTIEWEARFAVVEKFEDARLRKLGMRLIFSEHPHLLGDDLLQAHEQELKNRILVSDIKVPWMTVGQAMLELQTLKENCVESEKSFFNEHICYLEQQIARARLIV